MQECSITRLASNLPTVNPLPLCRSNHLNGPIPTGNIDGIEQVNLQSTMSRHAIAAEHGQSRRLSVNICSAAHATAYRTRADRNNNQDSHALHRRTHISPITPVVGLSLPPLTAHSAPAEDSCSTSAGTEMSLSVGRNDTRLASYGRPGPVRVLAYAPSNGTKQRTKHVPGNQGCPQTMWGLGQLATPAPAINRKSLVFQGSTRILRG